MSCMSDGALDIPIPDDLSGCHALIEQLACAVTSQKNQIEELQQEKKNLLLAHAEEIMRLLVKRRERYIRDPNQLLLDLGQTDEAADVVEGLAQAGEEAGQAIEVAGHKRYRRERKPRDESLPDHLPRYEVEAEVPEDMKRCPTHGDRKLIGYDTTESLEYTPAKLKVRVTKYPKFACPSSAGCGVASPDRAVGIVEGDKYDASVAAQVITAKYGYHLPVYRQQDVFAGSGWTPSRSTLLNILSGSAFVLEPLVAHIRRVVLASGIIGTDDTRVALLLPSVIPRVDPDDPQSKRIHEVFSAAEKEGKRSVSARMWAYRSITDRLNVFDFTVSRHRDGPVDMLADYRGILQADCYAGYEGIAVRSGGEIVRAACVTHARRKLFEAKDTYPVEAAVALALFQQLYDIEDRAKSMAVEERLSLRRREAGAIWSSLDEWRKSKSAKVILPKSDFGKALGYLNNHWDQLQVYLADGRLPIDNNEVEQLMKQIALGRKNWLFIGSVAAGHRAAGFFTLLSSALRNDLDVWAYLNDVLGRLLAGETDYAALRPDVWATEHPEAIRHYRVAERRDRADRKQYRRAARRKARRNDSKSNRR